MWISELSTRTGVARRTIRYYEDQGLLNAPERTPGGYRTYDHTTTERLGFIKAAKSLGLSLAEIARILELADAGHQPCHRVRTMVEEKIDEIDQRIGELHALRARLAELGPAGATSTATVCPIIEHA